MIFEETKVELRDVFDKLAEPGYFAVIPSFKIPASKVKFNGSVIETTEFETPETKLYCIHNQDNKQYLLFDNCLFNMSVAPFKDGKEICFKNSFLKKYIKKVFFPAFMKAVDFKSENKIKCDILSKVEVFGESEENPDGMLEWFKEPKHKIAMYRDYSDWWWLSDCVSKDEEVASSANFALVSNHGNAYCYNASCTNSYVRPRFVIERKA